MSEPVAKTPEAIQQEFLASCRFMVDYWAKVEEPPRAQLAGLLHSILCIIDGVSGGFPSAIDLVCRPHPDDKAYCIDQGEDWIEDGTVINKSVMLHEHVFSDPPSQDLHVL